jgi:hypothetical protein
MLKRGEKVNVRASVMYALCMVALMSLASATYAQNDEGGPGGGNYGGAPPEGGYEGPPGSGNYGAPPEGGNPQGQAMHEQMRQEMIAACQNQSVGDACAVSRGDRTVSGTCGENRQGQLLCRMKGRRRQGGGMGGPNGGGMPPNGGGMPPDSAPSEQ